MAYKNMVYRINNSVCRKEKTFLLIILFLIIVFIYSSFE